MGLYQRRIVPWLVHTAMKSHRLDAYREQAVSRARGRVLEIGIGSGRNLPLYGESVERVVGLDPSGELLRRAVDCAREARVPVTLVAGVAESLPFPDESFDTVLSTWTLCSIGDVAAALSEVARVLAPGGHFVFVEHGASPEPSVRRWQDRVTPLWCRLSGGCHLDREIDRLLADAGFHIAELEAGYGDGPRIATWIYEGVARPGSMPSRVSSSALASRAIVPGGCSYHPGSA